MNNEYEVNPTIELILELADEVMTNYQIAHALRELAGLVSPNNEMLKGVYLKAAHAVADDFARKLYHDEYIRLTQSVAARLQSDKDLESKDLLRRTVRHRGYILHQMRGNRQSVQHGYKYKECVWCDLQNEIDAESETVQQAEQDVISDVLCDILQDPYI